MSRMEEMNKMISDDMFAYMVAEDVKNKLSSSQKASSWKRKLAEVAEVPACVD